MIKIANNLQRLVKQASGAPQIMYSPELGGFHTPGAYPQSMLPEHYQQIQALNYINPARFEEPEHFNSAEDFAMALNTSGFANQIPLESIQKELNRPQNANMQFGTRTPEQYDYDMRRGLKSFAAKAYESGKRQPDQPAVMPAVDALQLTGPRRNDYEQAQRRMALYRSNPEKPFLHAAYDVTPDNPTGITARNPVSDARVADLASKKVREYIDSRNAKR